MTKPYFMHERFPTKREDTSKHSVNNHKRHVLRKFVTHAGRASLTSRTRPSIPLQRPYMEPVRQTPVDYSKLDTKFDPTVLKEKKLPQLAEKRLPALPSKGSYERVIPRLQEKRLPNLKERIINKVESRLIPLENRFEVPKPIVKKKIVEEEIQSIKEEIRQEEPKVIEQVQEEPVQETIRERSDFTISRVMEKNDKKYYVPLENIKPKKYGIVDILIADNKIKKIKCFESELLVDYEDYTDLPTGLKFKNQNEINKVIKVFAKEAKFKLTDENPILNTSISEGFKVHANYGTDFIPASFTLIRE